MLIFLFIWYIAVCSFSRPLGYLGVSMVRATFAVVPFPRRRAAGVLPVDPSGQDSPPPSRAQPGVNTPGRLVRNDNQIDGQILLNVTKG